MTEYTFRVSVPACSPEHAGKILLSAHPHLRIHKPKGETLKGVLVISAFVAVIILCVVLIGLAGPAGG